MANAAHESVSPAGARTPVYVIASSLEGTRRALAVGVPFGDRGPAERPCVVVVHLNPEPAETAAAAQWRRERAAQYRQRLADDGVKADIEVRAFPSLAELLESMPAGATIVIGGRAGSSPRSPEEELARELTRLGRHAVFVGWLPLDRS